MTNALVCSREVTISILPDLALGKFGKCLVAAEASLPAAMVRLELMVADLEVETVLFGREMPARITQTPTERNLRLLQTIFMQVAIVKIGIVPNEKIFYQIPAFLPILILKALLKTILTTPMYG